MEWQRDRRRGPFAVTGAALILVTAAIFALPDSLIELMQREGALEGERADWAYRLLALAAVAQAAWGAFAVLRPARVSADLSGRSGLAGEERARISASMARNAAGMTCLTLVYGVAAFALTGLRGGFWLFVLVVVAQGAWYYRAVGDIGRWLELQPESDPIPAGVPSTPRRDTYCPPLARALIDAGRDTR